MLLLAVSYALLRTHLTATLPAPLAHDALSHIAAQYVIAFAGVMLVAVATGWAVAGRVLAPLTTMTHTARQISEERLDRRIDLDGPDDELRDLADTFDSMLDRLERSFDAQRRFAANASHELRTPLTIIRSEAEVALANPEPDAEELRAMGEAVIRAASRTEDLLDGLLVLARSRRELLHPERLDLADLTRTARPGVHAAEAGVDVRLAVQRAEVTGDAMLLQRLIENLLENAVRHNHAGGWVRASTSTVGDRAVIEVANSGRRISDEDLPRITEPFERIGRRGPGGGSGLGLSVVRAVAEAHGGELELEARPPGGLIARVTLPLAAAPAPELQTPRGGSGVNGSPRPPRSRQPRPSPRQSAGRSSR